MIRKRWDYTNRCWTIVDQREVLTSRKLLAKSINEMNDVRRANRYYDSKTNTWIDMEGRGHTLPEGDSSVQDSGDEHTEGFSTCEIPLKKPEPQKLLTESSESRKAYVDEWGNHYKTCVCSLCRPIEIRHHTDLCACNPCWNFKRDKGLVGGTRSTYQSGGSEHKSNYVYVSVKPYDHIDYKKWPSTYMYLLGLYNIKNYWYDGKTIPDPDYRDRIEKGIYKPEPKGYSGHDQYDYWRNHVD